MQTKLSGFCDRMIEAGWLMALILSPLYFNVYSSRVFEPDKIILVRSIALLMALAWGVKFLDTRVLGAHSKPAAAEPASGSLLQRINRQNILTIPALLLVLAYIISTIASVAPMITLWGSYQRLQGTYSTFSYIVIFFLAASTIRSREQLDRIVTVAILTSVPTAVYGIVEHLKLEFLPWGGDVTLRVTSTMGNPIFIAAYLIMVVPLALSRFLSRLSGFIAAGSDETPAGSKVAAGILASVQSVVWFLLIYLGLKVYGDVLLGQPSSSLELIILLIVIILTIGLPFTARKGLPQFMSASFYGLAALVQLAAIVFSQSRGPQLGLAAGLVVFVFLYAMKKNSRVIWYGGLAAAILAFLFLLAINIPNSPLSSVCGVPYIGRMCTLIEEGGGSTTVRSLIWQGARELIGVHAPLQIPDKGDDALNPVRPLIGYGPDAMYVAYNRFYPPDLAHHEARNASPDRSHNETFDALVTTGVLGYLAYWIVFYTVIYMALIFLKVIDDRHGRYLYAALLASGLVALAIIYSNILPIKYTPGPPLLGIVVLGIYLVVAGIFTYDWRAKMCSLDMMLIALVAAVVAHFVEIQFGIAIASTRTQFWLFAAVIVVGGRLNLDEETADAGQQTPVAAAPDKAIPAPAPRQPVMVATVSKKKAKTVVAGRPRPDVRPAGRPAPQRGADSSLMSFIMQVLPSALPLAVVGGIILATMAYNYILPANNTASARTTSVQFWLYMVTWLSCGLVVAFDSTHDPRRDEVNERLASLIVYTVVSLVMWVVYVALHKAVSAVGQQVDPMALVLLFYGVILVYGFCFTASLYVEVERRPAGLSAWSGPVGGMVYAVVAVLVFILIVFTNVNTILADVYYKTGLAYDNAQRYDGSIQTYQSALRLTPGQDFYLLFLGRSYMELARQFPDRKATPAFDINTENPLTIARARLATLGRLDLVQSSLQVLLEARDLNPLNTDHYANLGRLYRFWGEMGDRTKFDIADKYFAQAVSLSPNNADLWDEWAIVSNYRGLPDEAEAKLNRSLELDDRYDKTYVYLGNILMSRGSNETDAAKQLDYLTKAADAYSSCLKLTPGYTECAKARGYMYGKYMGRSDEAIADFKLVAAALPKPEDLALITDATQKQQATQELIINSQNLAITYGQIGQFDQALVYAQIAANLAPTDQGIKTLVEQFKVQIQQRK